MSTTEMSMNIFGMCKFMAEKVLENDHQGSKQFEKNWAWLLFIIHVWSQNNMAINCAMCDLGLNCYEPNSA